MACEQLSLNGFIEEIKSVTAGTHPRKFCFVLGAGASRSSGIKSGQELVKLWDRELRERNTDEYLSWRSELKITDENMAIFYSHYYEKRFYRCPADGLNFIERIMESAKPSAGYVMLAHLLSETPHNVVITTNFDHLTEDAVTYYAQKTPLVIGHESLSHYINGQPVRPTIIKIHRDLLFDPKSTLEELEKLPESWQTALARIFENYHPVFVGYAGNDKSLMDFLIDNSAKFSSNDWKFPYWMLYKTDVLGGKVKDFLTQSDGFYIFHEGFDNVMIRLGAEFGYTIPTEEEFLLDAKKRFSTLKDAIDAFSDKNSIDATSERMIDSANIPSKIAATTDETGEYNSDVKQAIAKITSQAEVQTMFSQASTLIDEKKYDEAAEILEQLVELYPDNARYRFRLGDVYNYLAKYENALSEAEAAVKLDPTKGIHHFLQGRILEAMNLSEQALTAYQNAARLDADVGITHFATAQMQNKLGNQVDALNEYRKAAECNPDWDKPHHAIAEILEAQNLNNEALIEYRKAAELAPKWVIPRYSIAKLLSKMSRYEEALVEYQKAIEIEPDWSLSYYAMADLLVTMNRNEEALHAINKAISIDPERPYCYILLSVILRKLGRYAEAEEAESKADKLKP